MVSFITAVKSVSVNGRRRKLTGRPKENVIRRALMRGSTLEPLTPVNKLKTEVQVPNIGQNQNIKEMLAFMKGKLDFCGLDEWAPWSKLAKKER